MSDHTSTKKNRLAYHITEPKSRSKASRRTRLEFNEFGKIPPLSPASLQCLRNLSAHKRRPPKHKLDLTGIQQAAVLVALFVGRYGDLYVLLSRRSSSLRSYAGDTALPGGKLDHSDRSLEETARREAFEEIGLPRDHQKIPLLTILEPFLAANGVLVTPVVVLVLDKTMSPILNADEVDSLFSHPLEGFLRDTPPERFVRGEAESSELPYHTYEDYPTGRYHVFLTGREAGGIRPIRGLTAAICIDVARIGYAFSPEFEIHMPNEPGRASRIEEFVRKHRLKTKL